MDKKIDFIPRATGLMVIEVRYSNPNGDPDQDSNPRTRYHDGRGIISDVSFKRKIRELILFKEGPVWKEMSNIMKLDESSFGIYDDQKTREETRASSKENKDFSKYFWDVRVFGSTDLEKKKDSQNQKSNSFIRTGVAQFGIGLSAAKVSIRRDTNSVKFNVDSSRDIEKGMAPLNFRVVEHGVYAMPFVINPTSAVNSGCTRKDVELLLRLIPYAYSHNASRIRPFVEIRHAWYFEHMNPLGSVSDFSLIDELTPTKINPDKPSFSWSEYNYNPDEIHENIKRKYEKKYSHFGDVCNPEFLNSIF